MKIKSNIDRKIVLINGMIINSRDMIVISNSDINNALQQQINNLLSMKLITIYN